MTPGRVPKKAKKSPVQWHFSTADYSSGALLMDDDIVRDYDSMGLYKCYIMLI